MKARIFTDGACSGNPGPGGWALVLNRETTCYTQSGGECITTNNRMELTAVVKAYEEIVSLNDAGVTDEEYELYSDSAYVVNAIKNCWLPRWQMSNWKTTRGDDVKNRDLWERLAWLRNRTKSLGINVDVIKIKGHAGNTFNELADKLAKEEALMVKERAGSL